MEPGGDAIVGMGGIGAVDLALLACLLLSVIFGLVRGLVFEVLSAAGWVAAWFAAQWLTPVALPYVHVGVAGSGLNHGVTFALVFVAALIVWSLAARLVRLLVRATPLSPLDRVLGAGFGLARGFVLLLVLATLVALTPLRSAPAWQQSEGVLWLNAALNGIKPWLPPGLSRHLPA